MKNTSSRLYNPGLVRLLVCLCFTLLLFVGAVAAWGILPARQLASYDTSTQELSTIIRNTEYQEGYFKISFAGDLADYANYKGEDIIYISPETIDTDVDFTLTLPKNLPPGRNELKILFQEVPSETSTGVVDITLTLVGVVVVNVPYEGDYVSAQITIDRGEVSEIVPITISLLNKGDDSVVVWADVKIKGPTNELLDVWTTEKTVLSYQGSGKIETFWSGETNRGSYVAEVILHYAEKSEILEKQFVVGGRSILPLNINSEQFRLGEINKILITAMNEWNEKEEDVYAEIFVVEKDGTLVQNFKSVSDDFNSYQTKSIEAYWDTTNLLVGDYNLNVLLHFSGKIAQKSFPVTVAIDKLSISQTTGKVVSDSSDSGPPYFLFIILLLVVVVTNIVIIIYFRKSKKKQK